MVYLVLLLEGLPETSAVRLPEISGVWLGLLE